jgi:hypothetical protein
MIHGLAARFWDAKEWVHVQTGLSPVMLHVHLGLAIWLLAALIMRRPLRDWRPLALLAALQALNEVGDWLYFGRWRADVLWDCATTLFWPAIIMLVARRRR